MSADVAPRRDSPGGPQTGALDHVVIEQLRVDLEDEDGTAVAGLVSLYVASAQTLIPDLVAALKSGDTAAAARFAHALASPSALIGAVGLGSLLQRVQDGAHDAGGALAERAALAETISIEGERVVLALGRLP